MVPQEAAAVLLPGERVVWLGTPELQRPVRSIGPHHALIWVFGIACWVLGLLAVLRGLSSPDAAAMWAYVLVATLGGVLHAVFVRPRRLRRTTYVLTDRRALVVHRGTVRAHSAVSGPTHVEEDAEGTRITMEFGEVAVPDSDEPSERARTGVAFECVADVQGLLEASARVARRRTVQDRLPRDG